MTQTSLFGSGGKLCGHSVDESEPTGEELEQLADKLLKPKQFKPTLLDKVRAVMADGQWRASWQVQQAVTDRYGTYASDSSITARIRELRQVGLTVEARRVKGKNFSEYRMK